VRKCGNALRERFRLRASTGRAMGPAEKDSLNGQIFLATLGCKLIMENPVMCIRPMRSVQLTALALALSCCSSLSAEIIEYGWSGQLIPASTDDPWSLGPGGAHFDFRVRVLSGATDSSTGNIDVATFFPSFVNLTVAGQAVDYLAHEGELYFSDATTPAALDIIRYGNDFSKNGVSADIISTVAFLSNVFTFSQAIEPLPVFQSTTQVTQSTYAGSPYKAVVSLGTPFTVTVVPEPASLAQFAIALALFWRRRFLRTCLPSSRTPARTAA
jgi:hypothetical protein